ncbi:MAG: dihydropteroate synthase [Flavobacteriia bacterium]|jgi:dihydropteroate synthase|nr:dihydropteroate synthase [Cryomorphaceae bacterium]
MSLLRVEDTHFPKNSYFKIGEQLLDLKQPKIMGILNVSADSFYAPSRKLEHTQILETAEKMIREGADILDIGGYSTRPGAVHVDTEIELERVKHAISIIRKRFPDVILSVDTFRGSVAEAAIEYGANMINDISGLRFDPTLKSVVAHYRVPYILMHSRGSVDCMHDVYVYDHIVRDVISTLATSIQELRDLGVHDIMIDPGFGFSKTVDQNYELLKGLADLHLLECPILVGFSRKSMIWKKLGITSEEALNGTSVLNTYALMNRCSIFRVHDVKEMKEIVQLLG